MNLQMCGMHAFCLFSCLLSAEHWITNQIHQPKLLISSVFVAFFNLRLRLCPRIEAEFEQEDEDDPQSLCS